LNEDKCVQRLLPFYFAELNYIHPFREGQWAGNHEEFVRELLLINSYSVDWSKIEVIALLEQW